MDRWLASSPPEVMTAAALRLRRWRRSDAGEMARLVTSNLDHLRPWMPWAQGVEFSYAVELDGQGAIGAAGLHAGTGAGALEIGYWIDAGHTGHGYATLAARALGQAAMALREVVRLEIRCDRGNAASAQVARHLGFVLEGIEPRPPQAPAETGWGMLWVARRGQWTGATPPAAP